MALFFAKNWIWIWSQYCISLVCPQILRINKAKFLRDPIFWSSIFTPKEGHFKFLDTLYESNNHYFLLVYPFLKKDTTNAPHQKGKHFQGSQYFDPIIISQCSLKIRPFYFFGHPVWLKWPFISLVPPFFRKRHQKCTTSQRQSFLGGSIFWSYPYISIFIQK